MKIPALFFWEGMAGFQKMVQALKYFPKISLKRFRYKKILL